MPTYKHETYSLNHTCGHNFKLPTIKSEFSKRNFVPSLFYCVRLCSFSLVLSSFLLYTRANVMRIKLLLTYLHVNVNRNAVFSPVLLAWQRMANWTVYKPNRCLCKTHNTNQEVELRQNVQFLNTIISATGHQMHFFYFRCAKLWPQWDLTCKQRQQEQKRCPKSQLPLRVFPELTFCRTTNIQRTTHVKINENWTYTWRMKLWQRQKNENMKFFAQV